jgi:hypothetical protein
MKVFLVFWLGGRRMKHTAAPSNSVNGLREEEGAVAQDIAIEMGQVNKWFGQF